MFVSGAVMRGLQTGREGGLRTVSRGLQPDGKRIAPTVRHCAEAPGSRHKALRAGKEVTLRTGKLRPTIIIPVENGRSIFARAILCAVYSVP